MRLILQEALVACFLLTIPVTTAVHGIHKKGTICFHPDDAFNGPNYEYPCDENVESGYNTRPPTMAPSSAPSLPEPCVSSFGVFGDISSTSTVVDFGYELQTSSVAGDDIEELILPDLEVVMVDSVLSGLFPSGCAQTGTRKLQLQRRLQVEGISGNPNDIILDDSKYISFHSIAIHWKPLLLTEWSFAKL
jgi:hypothetical protein